MSSEQKFKFVSQLAIDLNRGDVKLPSFPDVVVRIRSALEDPDCTADQLAALIGTEPTLASRFLVYANSSYYNPGGMKIVSLTAAIGRLGFQQLRSVAITYAVEQLHMAKELGDLRAALKVIWQQSLQTGALSEVLAARSRAVPPDTAFIAGLLSRVGSLYILTKHANFPDLIGNDEARGELTDEWEAPIGESILSSWDFPADVIASVNPQAASRPSAKVELPAIVSAARACLATGKFQLEECDALSCIAVDAKDFEDIQQRFQLRLEGLSTSLAA